MTGGSVTFAREAVATLGPAGTDSAHEASRHFSEVVLTESFPAAIDYACDNRTYALVAAGFLDIVDGSLSDSWVDLHFRSIGRIELVDVWESPTKPMCLAINESRIPDREAIRSVALHPATAAIARQMIPHPHRMEFVKSKPIGVLKASNGEVDACVGSLDVVERARDLSIVETARPTMVWCLYRGLGSGTAKPVRRETA